MPAIGIPNFNALSILDIEPISFSGPDVRLVATAAYVNTDNGHTYGKVTWGRWSKETIAALHTLRELMEHDVADGVFTNDSSGPTGGPLADKELPGISEHAGVGATDADSV